MIIGANVSISGKGLLTAVTESLSYDADTFMIYTRSNRAPRKARKIEDLHVHEAYTLMKKHNMDIKNAVVHAPYTINLGGVEQIRKMGTQILREEIERTEELGIQYLVFHPGAHVGQGVEKGIQNISLSLNQILTTENDVCVCLEMMAGDGSKIGNSFEDIARIMDRVHMTEKLGVCIDTCHNWSYGYDIVNDFDGFLETFDKMIGLKYLKVAHINGSKFPMGAKKDRHANIGSEEDWIGKEALRRICQHEALADKPLILETPFGQYKEEILYVRGNDEADLSKYSLK